LGIKGSSIKDIKGSSIKDIRGSPIKDIRYIVLQNLDSFFDITLLDMTMELPQEFELSVERFFRT
jgi:hypothetical protein